MSTPLIIGWRERVDFTEWGIRRARAKIDTGARISAIDAIVEEVREQPDGSRTLLFGVRLFRSRPLKLKMLEAPLVKMARVRNTSGVVMERHVIETEIRLGPVLKRIQISIADRGRMLVPIILGRTALANDFVVDASRKYVLTS